MMLINVGRAYPRLDSRQDLYRLFTSLPDYKGIPRYDTVLLGVGRLEWSAIPQRSSTSAASS